MKCSLNIERKKLMNFKYLLFDLDGTLINTNKLIIDSFKYTLKKHIDLDIEESQIKRYFGEPLLITLERFSKDKAELMFKTYIEYNESIHDERVEIFQDVEYALADMDKSGHTLCVVTSKRKVLAKRGLEIFDLLKYFSGIIAYEDTSRHKPHPDPIIRALDLLNAKPEQALMIGDSEFDIGCAKNAGVKSAFVSWSEAKDYQDGIEPDYTISEISQLLNII